MIYDDSSTLKQSWWVIPWNLTSKHSRSCINTSSIQLLAIHTPSKSPCIFSDVGFYSSMVECVGRGPPFKQSLKGLVKQLFGFEIQNGSGTTGHDSVQDAQMALLLASVKIIEGESFLVGTPGEIHFPPRQFLPEHIESLIERKPAAEQHNSNFRFIFSTVPFNKLWERSLDGDSLTTDMYYTALRLGQSPSPTKHMTTTPTSVQIGRASCRERVL